MNVFFCLSIIVCAIIFSNISKNESLTENEVIFVNITLVILVILFIGNFNSILQNLK